jgi:type VI secretion system secreted protein VgrG
VQLVGWQLEHARPAKVWYGLQAAVVAAAVVPIVAPPVALVAPMLDEVPPPVLDLPPVPNEEPPTPPDLPPVETLEPTLDLPPAFDPLELLPPLALPLLALADFPPELEVPPTSAAPPSFAPPPCPSAAPPSPLESLPPSASTSPVVLLEAPPLPLVVADLPPLPLVFVVEASASLPPLADASGCESEPPVELESGLFSPLPQAPRYKPTRTEATGTSAVRLRDISMRVL